MENNLISWLSLWESVRASGIVSFLLLTVSVLLGMGLVFVKSGKWKNLMQTIHQSSGWFGFLFALFHAVLLLFEKESKYAMGDILIPFLYEEHRLWWGLGVLALWGLFFVLLSSDLMKRMTKKWWRRTHYLVFPVYLFSLVHGVMLGTDGNEPWMMTVYLVSGALFMLVLLHRMAAAASIKRTSPLIGENRE